MGVELSQLARGEDDVDDQVNVNMSVNQIATHSEPDPHSFGGNAPTAYLFFCSNT